VARFKELDLPEFADDLSEAVEIVRFFLGRGHSYVSLEQAPFEGRPHQWGFVLADIANHVANAEALSGGLSREEIFREIELGYRQRMENGLKVEGRNLSPKH
jgi:hypothetical protein